VAKFWYSKAADRLPVIGHLYHHLAILPRQNALQQLYLYCRSLISGQPFLSARESIQTLLDPVSKGSATHIAAIDFHFIKIHALAFKRGSIDGPADADEVEDSDSSVESINAYDELLLDVIVRIILPTRILSPAETSKSISQQP
jgi:hypothetical protein